MYIANALSPAQVLSVDLHEDEKTASVVVPERMLSLAIGKEGQNARLAAKLTGWRIDIKSAVTAEDEVAEESVNDDELARRAAALLRAEAASDGTGNGYAVPQSPQSENGTATKEEHRKVRSNNMVVYQNANYGPLPEEMAGETVHLHADGDQLEIRSDAGRVLATFAIQQASGEAESAEE